MKKKLRRKVAFGIGVFCIALLIIISEAVVYYSPAPKDKVTQKANDQEFSIIQITDTQYLSHSAPDLFNGLTSWIVNNSGTLNLTMVVHTGDIVQVANSTNDWNNANNAMMQLYNNSIPYCWDAGNHDQHGRGIGLGNPNLSWLGGNYPAFNVTAMRQQPYWAGDISNGKDTAVKFTFDNYHFMVINIEYDANQTVLCRRGLLIHPATVPPRSDGDLSAQG